MNPPHALCRVRFYGGSPRHADLPAGADLAFALNATNSPLLLACRTGICGTCLVEVLEGEIDPPDEEEREMLELLAPGYALARLACQLRATGGLVLRSLEAQ